MKKKRKILLVLKTPPPIGGGELRAKALKDYVNRDKDFIILEFSSKRLNKSTQGKFEAWKIRDFIIQFIQFLRILISYWPALVFLPLPKSFTPFVRNSLLFWAAYFFKIPCVGELAGMTFYFVDRSKVGRLYSKLVLSKMKCIRVLGNNVAEELNRVGINNTFISDNGVLIGKGIKYCANRKDGVVQLLFVGTHSPQKGFDILLKAFIYLIEKGHSVTLHTLGEWISSKFYYEMKRFLVLHRIENKIVFHGLKHGQEKWNLFSESQILVLPSFREGQPLVLLEGLGCGIPVVATRVGAIPETIENGKNGYLVETGSISQLSKCLENLVLNEKVRIKMSRANLELFQKRFTLEKFLSTQVNWLKACAMGNDIT